MRQKLQLGGVAIWKTFDGIHTYDSQSPMHIGTYLAAADNIALI